MNSSVSFSSKVTVSYQNCDHFRGFQVERIPFDNTPGRNIIPLPSVDLDELFRRVIHQTRLCLRLRRLKQCLMLSRVISQRFWNSLSQRLEEAHLDLFRESYLGHAKIHPRSDVGLWI